MAGLVGGELSYGDVIDTCYSASARLNGSENSPTPPPSLRDVATGKARISPAPTICPTATTTWTPVFADYEQWSGRNSGRRHCEVPQRRLHR